MSKKYLIISVILMFVSCKQKTNKISPLKVNNLRKTSIIKKTKTNDKLIILLSDNSWNAFKEYKELKSKIFINDNFDIIKRYDSLIISFSLKNNDTITFKYDKEYLTSTYSRISSNDFLKRNLCVISKTMNFNEYWNIRGATKQFSEIKNDSNKIDFLTLIINHSKSQKLKQQNGFETKRLILLQDFFKESGMENGWRKSDGRINANNLIKQLDTILSFKIKLK